MDETIDELTSQSMSNKNTTMEPSPVSCNTQIAFGKNYQVFEYVINVYIATIFIVFGLLGNLVSFVTLKHMKQASVIFLLRTLAVVDSLYLLTVLIFQSFRTLFTYSKAFGDMFWIFPYAFLVAWPLASMSQTASVWLVVLVTFDRFQAICHTMATAKQMTRKRAKLLVLLVVLGAICFNIPTIFDLRVVDRRAFCPNIDKIDTFATEFFQDPTYDLVYKTILSITFRAALPVLIVIILNIWMMCQIQSSEDYRAGMSRRASSGVASINIMITSIVSVYLICEVPDLTYRILRAIKFYFPEASMSWNQFAYFAQISNLFLTINSATNFVWYCLAGSKFRETLMWKMCGAGHGRLISVTVSSKKTTTSSAPGTPLLYPVKPLSIPGTPQIHAAGKTLSFPIPGSPRSPGPQAVKQKSLHSVVQSDRFTFGNHAQYGDVPTE